CRLVKATFASEGLEVRAAHDGASGLERAVSDGPDAVLLDLRLPDLDGLQVLEQLKSRASSIPVIMLTASREVKAAVRATQLGAFDYLTKPIDTNEVVVVVRRALEARALQREVEDLRERLERGTIESLALSMGPSSGVRAIAEQVRTVAASNFTVLVVGET